MLYSLVWVFNILTRVFTLLSWIGLTPSWLHLIELSVVVAYFLQIKSILLLTL